jgi:hypothetical protein
MFHTVRGLHAQADGRGMRKAMSQGAGVDHSHYFTTKEANYAER